MYQERLKIDWWTVAIWAILTVFGVLNIYSATYSGDLSSLFSLKSFGGKQLLWLAIATVAAILVLFAEPRFFSNGAYPIYAVVLLLLVATLFLAVTVNGGKSWIEIGGFRFQPSEFAKFATALALSKYMSAIDVEWKQMRTKLVALAIMGIPAGLVLLQHDAGSALVFAAFVLPLFREGLSGAILVVGLVAVVLFVLALLVNKYILIGALVLIALFYLFVWLNKRTAKNWWRTIGLLLLCSAFIFSVDILYKQLDDHQRERIEVLLGKNDDLQGSGYNVHQSKIAIGSGGFFGKGYLKGTITKADFVPEQHTDFIFCTVGEEWGWLGSSLLVALYVWLLVRLINMAERQRSTFSRFYGYSVASILFMHLFVNVGMVLGLVPVIGIPLPFFSYGGSSLLAFTILLFVFIRLDATKNQLY
ncbi:MAG: rod shape-determining protein RodA [Bacteroidales bacterium]|nr:rod shape-determining protein RodA [Bacteroidales bacterium]